MENYCEIVIGLAAFQATSLKFRYVYVTIGSSQFYIIEHSDSADNNKIVKLSIIHTRFTNKGFFLNLLNHRLF